MALAFLLLAVLAGSACSSPTRIVGGWPATIDKYPSIVQVEFFSVWTETWSQSCAANILNSRYVLSAAHCFFGILYRPERRRIRAGTTYRNTGGVLNYVETAINHPTYGQLDEDGDISVVRLSSPMVYTPVVQRGVFIQQGVEIPDHLPVQHAGWGTTQQGGSPSDILLETTIYIINNDLCKQRYANLSFPIQVTENMICAGLLDVGGRDACQGDSGGPLYFNDGQSGDIIIGIVSWGRGCADAFYPGVSTKVSSYMDWIVKVAA